MIIPYCIMSYSAVYCVSSYVVKLQHCHTGIFEICSEITERRHKDSPLPPPITT